MMILWAILGKTTTCESLHLSRSSQVTKQTFSLLTALLTAQTRQSIPYHAITTPSDPAGHSCL